MLGQALILASLAGCAIAEPAFKETFDGACCVVLCEWQAVSVRRSVRRLWNGNETPVCRIMGVPMEGVNMEER